MSQVRCREHRPVPRGPARGDGLPCGGQLRGGTHPVKSRGPLKGGPRCSLSKKPFRQAGEDHETLKKFHDLMIKNERHPSWVSFVTIFLPVSLRSTTFSSQDARRPALDLSRESRAVLRERCHFHRTCRRKWRIKVLFRRLRAAELPAGGLFRWAGRGPLKSGPRCFYAVDDRSYEMHSVGAACGRLRGSIPKAGGRAVSRSPSKGRTLALCGQGPRSCVWGAVPGGPPAGIQFLIAILRQASAVARK